MSGPAEDQPCGRQATTERSQPGQGPAGRVQVVRQLRISAHGRARSGSLAGGLFRFPAPGGETAPACQHPAARRDCQEFPTGPEDENRQPEPPVSSRVQPAERLEKVGRVASHVGTTAYSVCILREDCLESGRILPHCDADREISALWRAGPGFPDFCMNLNHDPACSVWSC